MGVEWREEKGDIVSMWLRGYGCCQEREFLPFIKKDGHIDGPAAGNRRRFGSIYPFPPPLFPFFELSLQPSRRFVWFVSSARVLASACIHVCSIAADLSVSIP